MTDANQFAWWEMTVRLAATVLTGLAAVICLPLLFASALNRGTFLGLPFGYFLVAIAVPVVLALAIFWFADRQRTLDHDYDVIED